MDNGLSVISYTLAAMAGICFVTGIAVLSMDDKRGKKVWNK